MKATFLYTTLAVLLFFFASCDRENKADKYAHLERKDRIRLMQYMQEGRRLYALHCANCHQLNGKGLAKLYPPLKDSDYLKANKEKVICGIRYGQKGEMLVNGTIFNQEMPPVPNITDLEIAEVATYVYTEFTDTVQIITINDVRAILENCEKQ